MKLVLIIISHLLIPNLLAISPSQNGPRCPRCKKVEGEGDLAGNYYFHTENSQCMNGCSYRRDKEEESIFCFEPGAYPVTPCDCLICGAGIGCPPNSECCRQPGNPEGCCQPIGTCSFEEDTSDIDEATAAPGNTCGQPCGNGCQTPPCPGCGPGCYCGDPGTCGGLGCKCVAISGTCGGPCIPSCPTPNCPASCPYCVTLGTGYHCTNMSDDIIPAPPGLCYDNKIIPPPPGLCYDDSATPKLLTQSNTVFPLNNIQGCRVRCGLAGNNTYFGVENGTGCYCGTTQPPAPNHPNVNQTNCNIPCPGNNTEICGGAPSFINVYPIQ